MHMCACVYMSMYVYKIIKLIYKFIIFQKYVNSLEVDQANSKDLYKIKIYNNTQEDTAAWK